MKRIGCQLVAVVPGERACVNRGFCPSDIA